MKLGSTIILLLATIHLCGQNINFPTAGGSPASPSTSVQYNNSGQMGGISMVGIANDLIFSGQGFSPQIAGNNSIYARKMGSAALLATVLPQDSVALLMQSMGNWRWEETVPAIGTASTIGTMSLSSATSPTAGAITNTSYRTMHRRLTFSGLTVGSGISTRSPDIITRNNSANSGGFIAQFCGTFPDNSTNGTGFMGLANLASNTYMPTMAGLTTVFGIGFDRNDSNYSIVYNDGSGNANKLDLGTNFPINITTTPWLELTLYCPPNSNYIAYMVTNRGNNKIATGSINSDIPSTSAMLKHYMGASPTVSGSVSYEFGGFKNASFY